MDLTIAVFCVPGFTGSDCNETDYSSWVNCSGNKQCMNGKNNFTGECVPGLRRPLCSQSGTISKALLQAYKPNHTMIKLT